MGNIKNGLDTCQGPVVDEKRRKSGKKNDKKNEPGREMISPGRARKSSGRLYICLDAGGNGLEDFCKLLFIAFQQGNAESLQVGGK